MLTGDNERTAGAIAAQVGVDDYRAELLPDEKVAAIDDLVAEYEDVAMVGDGINDAPAGERDRRRRDGGRWNGHSPRNGRYRADE